ncbi:MAG: class I SAM-dependent methyltransferase [Planctomycetota bacterium]
MTIDQWQDYDEFKTSDRHVAEYYEAVQTCQAGTLNELTSTRVGSALDIACGHGETTRALLTYASRVVGVDSSEDLIRKAKLIPHPHLSFSCSTFEAFAPESRFDLVSATWFLNHVHTEKGLIEVADKIKSLLNPGGIISFVVPGNSFTSEKSQQVALRLFGWRQAWFDKGNGFTRGIFGFGDQWIPTTIWEPIYLMRIFRQHFDLRTWDVKRTLVEHRYFTDLNVEPPFEVIYGRLRGGSQ